MEKRLFTSESVTEGHPDKVCDAISDAILDACMAEDPMSRVACETASCTGFVLVTGEITTKAKLDIPAIVRQTVNEIGYNDAKTGFDGNIHGQRPHLARTHARLPAVQVRRQGRADLHRPDALLPPVKCSYSNAPFKAFYLLIKPL